MSPNEPIFPCPRTSFFCCFDSWGLVLFFSYLVLCFDIACRVCWTAGIDLYQTRVLLAPKVSLLLTSLSGGTHTMWHILADHWFLIQNYQQKVLAHSFFRETGRHFHKVVTNTKDHLVPASTAHQPYGVTGPWYMIAQTSKQKSKHDVGLCLLVREHWVILLQGRYEWRHLRSRRGTVIPRYPMWYTSEISLRSGPSLQSKAWLECLNCALPISGLTLHTVTALEISNRLTPVSPVRWWLFPRNYQSGSKTLEFQNSFRGPENHGGTVSVLSRIVY